MNERWSAFIPGQPLSINDQRETHLIRGVRRIAWSDAFYAYRDMVAREVQAVRPRHWRAPEYLPKLGTGLLVIELDLCLSNDMDCDNLLKPLLDGVKVGLGTQIARTRTGRMVLKPVFDDIGFLPRFMSKRVVGRKGKDVGITLTFSEHPG